MRAGGQPILPWGRGVRLRVQKLAAGFHERYKSAALRVLRSRYGEHEVHVGMPALVAVKRKRWPLIIDVIAESPELKARIEAVVMPRSAWSTGFSYCPVQFVSGEKVAHFDKLLLAFRALALSRATGVLSRAGLIIHGPRYARSIVPLPKFITEVRGVLARIAALEQRGGPPAAILNKNCVECEYRTRCRTNAVESDDLSLLTTLNPKQRNVWNSRGIFTVAQLSYMFRPRRLSKRSARTPKHDPTLKALALRKQQIHMVGAPQWIDRDNLVYLDVEGVPDRKFYYLIGLRHKVGERYAQHSFWADSLADEREIWAACSRVLQGIDKPCLVHYGSYETQFLRRMKARYQDCADNANLFDHLTAVNLLSFTYAQIYFPTYTNTLKDIGRFLEFRWSESNASGLNALVWRLEWEASRDPRIKQKLITYNAEDCEAVQRK